MKNLDNDLTNWKSFMNVANYHGKPYMCDNLWQNASVPKKEEPRACCMCCIHQYEFYYL